MHACALRDDQPNRDLTPRNHDEDDAARPSGQLRPATDLSLTLLLLVGHAGALHDCGLHGDLHILRLLVQLQEGDARVERDCAAAIARKRSVVGEVGVKGAWRAVDRLGMGPSGERGGGGGGSTHAPNSVGCVSTCGLRLRVLHLRAGRRRAHRVATRW